MADTNDIGDDEILYRKVSVNSGWYDPERKDLKPEAFKPRADDVGGISFDRAKSDLHPDFRTMEEAAQGPSSNGYFVAVFRAGDLRAQGFNLKAEPDVQRSNPGHAVLQDVTYENRREIESQNKRVQLAHRLVMRVHGPFRAFDR